MTDAADMTERFARGLAEFSELCLASARDLLARQLAAEEATEAAACAGALHKVGRSLRQAMALEAKLRRDQAAAGREAVVRTAEADQKRRRHRRAQVEAALARLIWTEGEDAGEALETELSDLLDEEILADSFGDEPLDAHIARLCARLGVNPGPAPFAAAPPLASPPWQSSA